jgi:hypothetical protein
MSHCLQSTHMGYDGVSCVRHDMGGVAQWTTCPHSSSKSIMYRNPFGTPEVMACAHPLPLAEITFCLMSILLREPIVMECNAYRSSKLHSPLVATMSRIADVLDGQRSEAIRSSPVGRQAGTDDA